MHPLTNEHIVPEFLGGGLTAKFVCKPCNDKMGHGFEARLEKNLLFRAHRHEYDIRGKSKLNPKHPLQGDKTTKEGKRIPINADHSIYSYPDLDIEVDTDNHKISLSGTIDKSEQGKISSIIVKKYSVN